MHQISLFNPNGLSFVEGKPKVNNAKLRTVKLQRKAGTRAGLQDIWNAFMVEEAEYTITGMPICPSTATALPNCLISWKTAKKIHKREMKRKNYNYRYGAFIHFYVDDQEFDGKREGIWVHPEKALEIIRHFGGIIAPDFSIYLDFPDPLKRWNLYRMNAFGYWIGKQGIPVIANSRWGGPETWSYCWDFLRFGDAVAIGAVASGLKRRTNQPLFEEGVRELIARKHPKAIVVYGSAKYKIFDEVREQGIPVIDFPCETNKGFRWREKKWRFWKQ